MAYLLKYIYTASANKTIVAIHRDESLIPVFLAMDGILTPSISSTRNRSGFCHVATRPTAQRIAGMAQNAHRTRFA